MATYHVRNEEELEEQLPSAAIGDTIIIAHRNGPKKYQVVSNASGANGKGVERMMNEANMVPAYVPAYAPMSTPKPSTKKSGSLIDLRDDRQLSRGVSKISFGLLPKHHTIAQRISMKKRKKQNTQNTQNSNNSSNIRNNNMEGGTRRKHRKHRKTLRRRQRKN